MGLVARFLRRAYEIILNALFPRPAKVRELEKMSAAEISARVPHARGLEPGRLAALDYRSAIARTMVWEIKYRNNRRLASLLAALMYETLMSEIEDDILFGGFSNPVLVPVPLSKERFRERGYNQSEILAREMRDLSNGDFELDDQALLKTRNTPTQTSLERREDRKKNIKGCFSPAEPRRLRGRNVILVDDVTTTGATFAEAAKTLRKAGAKRVICLAGAH